MRPLVIVQHVDPEGLRRLNAIAREQRGRRLSALQAGDVVRRMGAIAPFRCPCGCGRIISHEDEAKRIERGAVPS